MLSILRKATESLKKSGESDLLEQYDVVEDLSVWEIINASLSDDEDCYSLDDDEPEAKPIEEEEEDEDARESRDLAPPDGVVLMESLSFSPPATLHADLTGHLVYDDDNNNVYDDDDDDDDDDVYDDVDDDLVKWKLKGFGKGRMKVGRWGVRKVKNSKRLPYYYYNRP